MLLTSRCQRFSQAVLAGPKIARNQKMNLRKNAVYCNFWDRKYPT